MPISSSEMIASEIRHRWKTSFLLLFLVASITGTLTFFVQSNAYYQKEVVRDVRDLGANVVILPSHVQQIQYFQQGGYSEATFSEALLESLVSDRLSLNHLIPIVERWKPITAQSRTTTARAVGIAASIPTPGRPKAPMQKPLPPDAVQLGSLVAEQLQLERRYRGAVVIADREFKVDRVNRETGTWQDAAVFLELKQAQSLFGLAGQLSRVEALECLDEDCQIEEGKTSEQFLQAELAQVTDQLTLLRRANIAEVREKVRSTAEQNLAILQVALWFGMVVVVVGLGTLNSIGRLLEVGVLRAIGYGSLRIVALFLGRILLLAGVGCVGGSLIGAAMALWWARQNLISTQQQVQWAWDAPLTVAGVAALIALVAGSLPVFWVAARQPAEIVNRTP